MNFILFMYDFFKGLLYFFIVHLLEIPDVIMTLQINISYIWVTHAPGKEKKPRTTALYDFDHVCAVLTLYRYTLSRRS